MFYFVKTPSWIQMLFPSLIWKMNAAQKNIYLSFDDGPHPVHTTFVLNELKKYNAKATFFCIGNNVQLYPDVYKRIIEDGHSIGNHTYNHVKGKQTSKEEYITEVDKAATLIKSNLFRPPYGSITKAQTKLLKQKKEKYNIIMWTVLSGDFDTTITKEKCLKNVLTKTENGSIVVFHDSEKAAEKMLFSLPLVLDHFSKKGYNFTKM
jgi:peptidoglycan-N-acetylglucosamine deacetylase